MGIYETSRTNGDTKTAQILEALTRFGMFLDKLRDQCYDSAAIMSGVNKCVQAKLTENYLLLFMYIVPILAYGTAKLHRICADCA